jgi:FtsH-binding integral membrane protein
MKKTILTFGLISGAISSLMIVITTSVGVGFDKGPVIGYTTIVLSFLLVFFGLRSYRDNIGNGQITFLKGFAVGISITLISCICYVLTWEVMYYNVFPDFWDKYGAHLVEKLKVSGASPAAIQAKLQQVKKYKELYKNPLLNAAMTLIEPFTIGLVITLISAVVLSRKPQSPPERSPLQAS